VQRLRQELGGCGSQSDPSAPLRVLRLEAAISRYHANVITTAQVIEELMQLAKDIRADRARGGETGLTDEEVGFYDALAENERGHGK
jgi:type I site-specific restriction-modification system R (restriction) subunit